MAFLSFFLYDFPKTTTTLQSVASSKNFHLANILWKHATHDPSTTIDVKFRAQVYEFLSHFTFFHDQQSCQYHKVYGWM